jgi:hypothetical protein
VARRDAGLSRRIHLLARYGRVLVFAASSNAAGV